SRPRAEPSGVKPPVCFYVVLGVSRTASSEEIKKAHRKLSMRWHPDRVAEAEKERATKKMAEINQANDVLSDGAARAFYDRTG
ncbi:DnaJ-domain-containing protein, partial [Dothidotthia symphoricarpi CBS 119687]